MMKKLYILLFISFLFAGNAQNLYPSRVKFETDTNGKVINAISTAGVVQVNEGTSEIALKVGIYTINTDNDELDSLLSNIENQFIYLKGNFPITNLNFTNRANESGLDYTGKANVTINGITQLLNYTCNVFPFNNSDDEFSVGNTVYPLRINLSFSFEPEIFKLDALYPSLKNPVKIEIANGFINKLNPGGDNIFKN